MHRNPVALGRSRSHHINADDAVDDANYDVSVDDDGVAGRDVSVLPLQMAIGTGLSRGTAKCCLVSSYLQHQHLLPRHRLPAEGHVPASAFVCQPQNQPIPGWKMSHFGSSAGPLVSNRVGQLVSADFSAINDSFRVHTTSTVKMAHVVLFSKNTDL
ncbi:unnamed protein product [Protopolystoma xenopodis]|uniref:Uncharacterized protein n=1 Tax=Protopolystoma xenopodis TaxID=117903 RepID=A0A448X9D5_9PLAT|nr:unnamed protein product [Protopolystoma xenopodis]